MAHIMSQGRTLISGNQDQHRTSVCRSQSQEARSFDSEMESPMKLPGGRATPPAVEEPTIQGPPQGELAPLTIEEATIQDPPQGEPKPHAAEQIAIQGSPQAEPTPHAAEETAIQGPPQGKSTPECCREDRNPGVSPGEPTLHATEEIAIEGPPQGEPRPHSVEEPDIQGPPQGEMAALPPLSQQFRGLSWENRHHALLRDVQCPPQGEQAPPAVEETAVQPPPVHEITEVQRSLEHQIFSACESWRDDADGCFSLSIRRTNHASWDSIKHYRINRLENGWLYISPRLTFSSLHDLVDYYSELGDGLCCSLKEPCFIEGSRHIPMQNLPEPVTVKKPALNWKELDSSVLFKEDTHLDEESPVSLGLREAISSYLFMTEDQNLIGTPDAENRWKTC